MRGEKWEAYVGNIGCLGTDFQSKTAAIRACHEMIDNSARADRDWWIRCEDKIIEGRRTKQDKNTFGCVDKIMTEKQSLEDWLAENFSASEKLYAWLCVQAAGKRQPDLFTAREWEQLYEIEINIDR